MENKIIRDKLTHLLNMVEVRKSIDLFRVKIQNFRFQSPPDKNLFINLFKNTVICYNDFPIY